MPMTTPRKPHIVIVDDSTLIRALLRAMLEEEGFAVVGEASTGAKALECCERSCPDLACLDIEMPEMNGLQTLAALRTCYPHLPIVMISTNATLQNVQVAIQQGATDFIVKPFTAAKVCETLQRCLAPSVPEGNASGCPESSPGQAHPC
jgi:two-component system, chemotaxis family, chemotaxis protein CheY